MSLLAKVDESMRYWTDAAMREGAGGDKHNLRDTYLDRAAKLATISLALRFPTPTKDSNHG